MSYKVSWKFGADQVESQDFEDRSVAQIAAETRGLAYAKAHGRCATTIHDERGQEVLSREDSYSR